MGNTETTEVVFESNTYELLDDPYVDSGSFDEPCKYEARAVKDGEEYLVVWEATPEWEQNIRDGFLNEDECDACDWDNPISVSAV